MTTTDAYRLGHAHGATLDPSAHLAACDAGWAPGMSPEFIDDYNAGFNAGWDEAGLANEPDHAAEVSRQTGWSPSNSVD